MLVAYLSAVLAVIAAQTAPGPNLVAVAGAALGQGRRVALFIVFGVASGTFLWVTGVALGLGQVFERLPESLTLLKFIGGGYLVYVGIKSARSALSGGAGLVRAQRTPMSDGMAFRRGLLVVLTNPKSVLLWSAIATFLFGAGFNGLAVFALGPMMALTAVAVYGTYAVLFSSRPALGVYARFARGIELVFAGLFGTLGGVLLWAGIRDLRP